MENRLRRVEDEVVEIRNDVQHVKETVLVLDERQTRMHRDFTDLTEALNKLSTQMSTLNRWADKRGAFVAGMVFIIGAFGTAVAGILTLLKDWFGA